MITIDQWRAAIGCFNPTRTKTLSAGGLVLSGGPIRLGLRLTLALSLCLILSGDVESNPGPPLTLQDIHDNINSKFDIMQLQITDISKSILDIKTNMSVLDQKVSSLSSSQQALRQELSSLRERVDSLETECERQEQYSRRENVIIHGIGELPGESYDSLRSRITTLLNNNIKSKTWHEGDIVRAHRMGKHHDSSTFSPMKTKPRPVIVRLHQFQDKLTILKARATLKPLAIGVSGDLTQRQREQLKRLPDDKRGYFRNGKLVIVDKTTPPDQRSRHNNYRDYSGQQTSDTPGSQHSSTQNIDMSQSSQASLTNSPLT